jgi:hypothetical protein
MGYSLEDIIDRGLGGLGSPGVRNVERPQYSGWDPRKESVHSLRRAGPDAEGFQSPKRIDRQDNVEVNSVEGGKGQDSEGSCHNLEIEARRLMDNDSIMLRE